MFNFHMLKKLSSEKGWERALSFNHLFRIHCP